MTQATKTTRTLGTEKKAGASVSTRTALIGIIVEDRESAAQMNSLLHDYSEYIIGRMGVPHPKKPISIISIALEADGNTISALSGKLGALPGISTKTIYAKTV